MTSDGNSVPRMRPDMLVNTDHITGKVNGSLTFLVVQKRAGGSIDASGLRRRRCVVSAPWGGSVTADGRMSAATTPSSPLIAVWCP
jgi:hypothetical protein